MSKNLIIKILLICIIPSQVFANCDPKDDGDCCTTASDCTAYFHPSLCAVIPLNKIAAANLEKEKPPTIDFCQKDTIARLKEDAKSKKPICLVDVCEFDGDNG